MALKLNRRQAAARVGAALLAASWGTGLRAEKAFPARPLSLWVPWQAGGATDLTMRVLADIAGRSLGQKVNIENRGGAGGTLVMPVLQQAAADGYTIAQLPQPVLRAPFTQKVLWDPLRDTTPIIQLSGVNFGVVVANGSPFKTFADLLGFAKEHPGRLSVGTNGVGTTPHLVMDELMAAQGSKYIHVPYKGTAEQMLNVASGQVMAGVNSSGFAPYVDSGALRLLVTFGAERTARYPQVPTLKELGFGTVAMSPYGLVGPAGLPAEVVGVLHDAFRTALFDPAHVAELAKYDQVPVYLGPADYGQAMRVQSALERRNVERLGLGRPSTG
jgi:tripartite-type tricarboxylate transporter receptor subunit TctC